MTKGELIRALEPFVDEVEIGVSFEGNFSWMKPIIGVKYHPMGDRQAAAKISLEYGDSAFEDEFVNQGIKLT